MLIFHATNLLYVLSYSIDQTVNEVAEQEDNYNRNFSGPQYAQVVDTISFICICGTVHIFFPNISCCKIILPISHS